MSNEKEQPFLEHLEELRWHLIRALTAVAVLTGLAFTIGTEFVFDTIVMGPSKVNFPTYRFFCWMSEVTCIEKLPFTIQNREMSGQFTMHIAVSAAAGLVGAFPYIFWEIWRFVSPALYSEERRAASGATFFVSFQFFLGVLFGYYVVAPLSINFLSNYQISASIINEIDLSSYVSTVLMLSLLSGLMFELPVIVYVLSLAGIVNAPLLRHFRRHALVVILILAAIITPPDVVSQFLIALPVYGLYEMSIFVSAWVWKQREKKEAKRREQEEREKQAETEEKAS
jgi:sec-independent protein translocase protein TatC